MENLEEEITNATTPDVEIIATMDSGPPSIQENLNDSVEIIENPIEVLDLTSPQPSTSSSNSAGAVGASNSVKRNIEEALKETNTDQNPSTSSTANTTSSSSNNSNNLLECPICLQTCIHPARLPCGHIFCFLCVKGVAYKNRRCAMCRREIPPEFLDHPQLVNGIEDICTTKATDDGYQWFYEGRNGGWWAYEKRNASEIEEAFQNLHNKNTYHQLLSNALKEEIKKENNKRADNNDNEEENDESDYEDENEDGDEDEDYYYEGEANNKKKNLNPFTFNIQICGTMYTVDFQNMIQYPESMPYRKRKICRAKGLPAKGVAGILTSKLKRRMRPY